MPLWMNVFNAVALFFWIFQVVFAFLYYKKCKNTYRRPLDHVPKLSVVIPVYNENKETLKRVLESLVCQRYVELEVFIIDDGSIEPVIIENDLNASLIRLETNCGKRFAQIEGVKRCTTDWVVTLDSDTILKPYTIFELYRSVFNSGMDAMSGTVHLYNEKQNYLTRITACMYWFSFFQERSSQSYFNAMTCCSGALSIYKKNVILDKQNDYLEQKFLGLPCKAGDDRFLTCLFAISGKKIGWTPFADAYTVSPALVKDFIKQQLRWARSHIAALSFIWSHIKSYPIMFLFFGFKMIFRYSYFFSLYLFIIYTMFFQNNWMIIFLVLLSTFIITLIKIVIAWLYTKSFRFLWLFLYSLFSFFIFTPFLVYGVFTPTKMSWMTRTKKSPQFGQN